VECENPVDPNGHMLPDATDVHFIEIFLLPDLGDFIAVREVSRCRSWFIQDAAGRVRESDGIDFDLRSGHPERLVILELRTDLHARVVADAGWTANQELQVE